MRNELIQEIKEELSDELKDYFDEKCLRQIKLSNRIIEKLDRIESKIDCFKTSQELLDLSEDYVVLDEMTDKTVLKKYEEFVQSLSKNYANDSSEKE
jgi:hypothetical protein